VAAPRIHPRYAIFWSNIEFFREQRRAVGRSWSEITKQIDSDERERDLCRRKANEVNDVSKLKTYSGFRGVNCTKD
jgi:hypothetical protein